MTALIATIATVLANIPISTLMEKFEEQLMEAKDARMKTTSECLRNMRILKLQVWIQFGWDAFIFCCFKLNNIKTLKLHCSSEGFYQLLIALKRKIKSCILFIL